MSAISTTAERFLDACMGGRGWEGCRPYCLPNATLSIQADMFADVDTVEAYAERVKAFFTPIPDFRHEVQVVAVDEEGRQVGILYTLYGTHTAEGGPVPPTGRSIAADSAMFLAFDGERIHHVTKVFNDVYPLKQIGWA